MTDIESTKASQGAATPQARGVCATWLRTALASNAPVWLVAAGTLANGLLGMGQGALVRFHERAALFNLLVPFGLHHWSRSLNLLFGLGLVYLSWHLLQRRRVAWWFAAGGALAAGLTHLGRGHLWHLSVAPFALLALLLVFRPRFSVRSEPRSIAQGLAVAIIVVTLALAYGVAGFWMMEHRDFGLDFSVGDGLLRTFREMTFLGNPDLVASTRHARWFLESLRVLGVGTALLAGFSLFRPLAYRLRTLPHERAHAKAILGQYGRSSLDYFKLNSDKSYLFSRDRRSCVAYRTAWSVAVALGDPVGPEDGQEEMTRAFLRFCEDNGWTACFHQVLPDLLPVYRRLGLQALKIGEEAVVDLDKFESETLKEVKEFRRARRKFEGDGFCLERRLPPHSEALIDEVKAVSDEWLSLPGRRERGFTMGRFERGYIEETPLVVVKDPSGRVIAFVNEVPAYRPGETTIDLMRHRKEIPNGTMDYLFVGLLLKLRQEGYTRFNLGLAPFAGVGDRPGASLEERAVHQLFERLNRFFSYKGLHQYKAKFDPAWEERFLVYQGGPPGLVRAALALTQVTEGHTHDAG